MLDVTPLGRFDAGQNAEKPFEELRRVAYSGDRSAAR
jgi:hypothetical protein